MLRTIRLSAQSAFEDGQGAWEVQWDPEASGVVLHDALLIEDDGPAANGGVGRITTEAPPTVTLAGPVWVKKLLHLDSSRALQAWLLIRSWSRPPAGQPGNDLSIDVNGTPLHCDREREPIPVPVALLRPGRNEILIRVGDSRSAILGYAPRQEIERNDPQRRGREPRSFLSSDAGHSWQAIDGELNIRLQVQQRHPEGCFISPVLDAGRPDGDDPELARRAEVRGLSLEAETELPPGTRIDFAVRSGSSPVFDDSTWSTWRAAGHPVPGGHDFIQWRATLATSDPLVTPVLRMVTVKADLAVPARPEWMSSLRCRDAHNETIRHTSIPFAYEDFLHPQLQALRTKYRLDEVVGAATSELEQLVRLRNWVAQQWTWTPPGMVYPPWDADAILKLKSGFCVQFAIVYMQCALSLGFTARFVFGHHPKVTGGHEVCEVWSNQLRKWVFIDAADNIHHVDPPTGTPLDMLEIHERMLQICYGRQPATPETRPQEIPPAPTIGTTYRLDAAMSPPPEDDPRLERRRPWAMWLLMHMVPRNDFYSAASPTPKIQGFNWEWTGYWLWEDEQTPRSWRRHLRNRTSRRADWQWTLNQVRFAARYGTAPRTIDIRMGTVTPGLDGFLVRRDGGDWQRTAAAFTWALRPGENRLEMRVRNRAGVLGPVSFLCVQLDAAAA